MTTEDLTEGSTYDEVGEDTHHTTEAVDTETSTQVGSESPFGEGGEVIVHVCIETEAELLTEVKVEVRDEVELRVEDLQISTSANIEAELITEVRSGEEGSTVEGQRFLCFLDLHFLGIDFTLSILTSDDDVLAAILLILELLLEQTRIAAGGNTLLDLLRGGR